MKGLRKIDDQGRFLIPMDIRKAVGLKGGDDIEIFVNKNDIILRKHSPYGNIDDKKIHKAVSTLLPEEINFAIFINGDRLCTNDERFPDWLGDVDSEWIREKFSADSLEVAIATDKETDLEKVKEIIKIFVEEN